MADTASRVPTKFNQSVNMIGHHYITMDQHIGAVGLDVQQFLGGYFAQRG